VMLVTSSLAGSPNKSNDTKFLYDEIFHERLVHPEKSTFLEKTNRNSIDYFSLIDILQKTYSEVKVPDYVTIPVQMARSYVESSNNPHARSPVGARGLWQIMEQSWYDVMDLHFDNAYNPYLNSKASLYHINKIDMFLRQHYIGSDGHTRFDQLPIEHKRDLLNAAYNGGQGRLMRANWDINAMPKETRDYVKRMKERTLLEEMRIYQVYKHQNIAARLEIKE